MRNNTQRCYLADYTLILGTIVVAIALILDQTDQATMAHLIFFLFGAFGLTLIVISASLSEAYIPKAAKRLVQRDIYRTMGAISFQNGVVAVVRQEWPQDLSLRTAPLIYAFDFQPPEIFQVQIMLCDEKLITDFTAISEDQLKAIKSSDARIKETKKGFAHCTQIN